MAERQIMRTLIVETPAGPGNFAKVATAIGNAMGDIGYIKTIIITTLSTVRDISVYCGSEQILEDVVEAVRSIGEGILVHAVSD